MDVYIKDGYIMFDCKVCGQCIDVDLCFKLSGFIFKNVFKKIKKDKVECKVVCKVKQNGGKDNGFGEENGFDQFFFNGDIDIVSDDDVLICKIKKEVQNFDSKFVVDKEVEWVVDMSEEVVKVCQQVFFDEFKVKFVLNGEDEDEDGEGGNIVYDQLVDWIQVEVNVKGGVDNVDDVEIYFKVKEFGIEVKYCIFIVLVMIFFNENIFFQIFKC